MYVLLQFNLNTASNTIYTAQKTNDLTAVQFEFILALLDYAMSHNFFWFGGSYYLQNRGVAMGAKFAPSMANLFMAKWEEDVIYSIRRLKLVLWRRYIDDVLLIWDGDQSSLDRFMIDLNNNDRSIRLQHESSGVEVHFLDLKIRVVEGLIITSTSFKETDRTDSCHQPA